MKTLEQMNPAHAKVLKRIQDSIPKSWYEGLIKKVPVAPGIKEACERAVKDKDPKITAEVKKKAQMLLDSGMLDKFMEVEDPKYARLINTFLDKEIAAAIKRGELPKGKKHRNIGKNLMRITKEKAKANTKK